MITLHTNFGDIKIELDFDKAPITAQNFTDYIESEFYHDTIFHRVIKNFMIQGGGFAKDMQQKATNPEIQNEADNGLKNNKYTIAMARTNAPHSASSQFFINTADNAFLDFPGQDGWGYCVFGKVVDGFETIDKINEVTTGVKSGHSDVPNNDVVIDTTSK